MDNNLAGLNLSDLSIIYVLLAVLIVLALLAAVGAWVRGGGIKREDAESLFAESRERSREEIARLEQLLDEARRASDEAHSATRDASERANQEIATRLQSVDEQVLQSRTGIEAAVTQASTEYNEALSEELEMVTRKLADADRRLVERFNAMEASLGEVHKQVGQAGESIRQALLEMTRRQQEQKAQSTIQLCEALISSLGTLKSTIVTQLEDNVKPDAVHTDADVVADSAAQLGFGSFDAADADGGDVDNVAEGGSSVAETETSDQVELAQQSDDAQDDGNVSFEDNDGRAEYQPSTTAEHHFSPSTDSQADAVYGVEHTDLDLDGASRDSAVSDSAASDSVDTEPESSAGLGGESPADQPENQNRWA